MGKYIVLLIGCIVFSMQLFAQSDQAIIRAAQTGKEGASAAELVSFKSDLPYSRAMQALSELSKKLTNKIIIDRSPMRDKETGIGINIESMYWKDAFELILRTNQLWYNDNPEYMEIISLADLNKPSSGDLSVNNQGNKNSQPGQQESPQASVQHLALPAAFPAPIDSGQLVSQLREVTISSVFFEIDRSKADQIGISWSFFRGNNANLGVAFTGANLVTPAGVSTINATSTSTVSATNTVSAGGSSTGTPLFGATAAPTGLSVDINAALSIFQNEQIGEIIARPEVTVRSGSTANIQIGQDFSVREKDFSGNTVEKFYPSGTILSVTPHVIKAGEMEFIDLDYHVERSAVTVGDVSTIINKTLTSGRLTLLDHEESYIGGLYDNDVTIVREGIPILKDLPWWVFGLRYIFGYNSNTSTRKELIVLLKADFVPTLEERAASLSKQQDVIKEKLGEIRKDLNSRTTLK